MIKNQLKQKQGNSILQTIDDNITHGVMNGVLHLTAKKKKNDGKTSIINKMELLNFSSYSYLGLEHHDSLKKGCIDAVQKYGTQFGFSRAFLSIDLYDELECYLSEIFGAYVVVAPSTTLAHQAALPVMIEDGDVIIIDQQAHASIHFAVKSVRDKGIKVEMVRHNRIDQIEEKILNLKHNHKKIWYLCDSVYSMFGDYAPLKELERLMNKYEQFHIYIDDAHGMSWQGLNGRGYVLSQIDIHTQMILITSLNKAYAAAGGVIILPSKEWKRKIRTCGGTLIFSTPIQPPMLGAGVASAKIHLTEEINSLQNNLREKIEICSRTIGELGLPEVSKNNSPIFYLPTSFPKVSYNLTKRMMERGYYLTPTLFPAVSMRKAGIRFCVNLQHTSDEIRLMLNHLAIEYPLALAEESVKLKSVLNSFKIDDSHLRKTDTKKVNNALKLTVCNSIEQIDKGVWDMLMGDEGSFDWNALKMLEQSFKDNPKKEDNWFFYYYLIFDENDKIVLATFFTKCWCKDDIFKKAEISEEIERLRTYDPYYLCSEVLMMGTLITEGQHLFLDKSNDNWQSAVLLLLETVNELQEVTKANSVYLRDFQPNDFELSNLLITNGFIKSDLPDFSHVNSHLEWDGTDEFLHTLTQKKRQQLRTNVLKYEEKYQVTILQNLEKEDLEKCYQLYLNVKKRSMTINTFTLPFKVFENMNLSENWEMIVLRLSEEEHSGNEPIAVVFSCKTENNYIPVVMGLDYRFNYSHKNYKQALYQMVKRANELKAKKLYLGLTASLEKRRVGAIAFPKCIFVQQNDSFNMEVLEMANGNEFNTQ